MSTLPNFNHKTKRMCVILLDRNCVYPMLTKIKFYNKYCYIQHSINHNTDETFVLVSNSYGFTEENCI